MSPLRYPGGKGQLYARMEALIAENQLRGKTYVEPFAGGFSIGLNLLLNGIIDRAIINDYDCHLFAFWESVFNQTKRLIKLIQETEITIEEWHKQREIFVNPTGNSHLKIAFSTLFLNRTNFSGILGARPIGGLRQTGALKLDCRFHKPRLIEQIKRIGGFRDKVEIYNLDALQFIKGVIEPQQTKIFVNFDPPYVQQGAALYTNFYTENDHAALAEHISKKLRGDWIMTYDDHPLIYKIYKGFIIKPFQLNYNAKGARKGQELFIAPKDYNRTFAL